MVKLVPLAEDEYRRWFDWFVVDYERDLVRSGLTPERARERARIDIEEGLPQGLQSKDQYLYSVRDEATGQGVGVLWLSLMTRGETKLVFVSDILIYEQFRGKGYGKQTMLALEDRARELGATRIGLHVFGHNQAARELYKRMGYVETNVNMAKDL